MPDIFSTCRELFVYSEGVTRSHTFTFSFPADETDHCKLSMAMLMIMGV